jgi:hypothetical protein
MRCQHWPFLGIEKIRTSVGYSTRNTTATGLHSQLDGLSESIVRAIDETAFGVLGLEGQGPLGSGPVAELVEGPALFVRGGFLGVLNDLLDVGLEDLGLVGLGHPVGLGLRVDHGQSLLVGLDDGLEGVGVVKEGGHRNEDVELLLVLVFGSREFDVGSRLWMMEGRKKTGALYRVGISTNPVCLNCH